MPISWRTGTGFCSLAFVVGFFLMLCDFLVMKTLSLRLFLTENIVFEKRYILNLTKKHTERKGKMKYEKNEKQN